MVTMILSTPHGGVGTSSVVQHKQRRFWFAAALILACCQTVVTARAILGVDLGSLYMKVALVQSGSPLEIVTNLHSKRKTEQMILFDRGQRFYGADAASLLARKSHQTPAAMSVLLGRDDEHPVVRVLTERHYPVTPRYNETRQGVVLPLDGMDFTPEELVAMVLTHAVDISVAHAASQGSVMATPPQDVVLTVPSFATQRERQALLDAAALAGLNVLTLIDETTAAALQYAMDKTFADAEGKTSQDEYMLFYNMGASSLQVAIVHFFSYEQPQKYGKPKRVPALAVLAKAWDETLGGEALDHIIVEHLADEFNHAYHAKTKQTVDVRTDPRAMIKLRLQANKVKHVLSANADFPIYLDSLHNEVPLHTHISREQLEAMAVPLLQRAVRPVEEALARANKTVADLTGMELIGGGMRVPCIQAQLSQMLANASATANATNSTPLELGLHMNADESMALGAAFAGANLSTAFRVRHVGMTDVNPFPFKVTLTDIDSSAKDADAAAATTWTKETVLFKSFGKLNIKKTIAFSHDQDVVCALDYSDDPAEGADLLPAGTERNLIRYRITGVKAFASELKPPLGPPKVSLQFELSSSGIASLIKAEATVEETYTVQEEVEVDDDEAAAAAENATEAAAAEGDAAADKTKEDADAKDADKKSEKEEAGDAAKKEDSDKAEKTKGDDKKADAASDKKKPEAKPKKRILVDKEKKRTLRRTLTIETTHLGRVQPHSPEQFAASRAKLLKMAEKDKERMMLEESRNKLESYIYRVKNTLNDREKDIAKVTTEEQRTEAMDLATEAHDWMEEEGYKADFASVEAKYAGLSGPFDKIMLRLTELKARPAAVDELRKKLTEVEQLMAKWETTKPQVTAEERGQVLEEVEKVRKWLDDQEQAQAAKKPHEDPAFVSTDVPDKIKPVETLVVRLSKKPKPKPVKKEKDANKTDDKDSDNATESKDSAEDAAEPSADGEDDAAKDADGDSSKTDKAEDEDDKEEEPIKDDEL